VAERLALVVILQDLGKELFNMALRDPEKERKRLARLRRIKADTTKSKFSAGAVNDALRTRKQQLKGLIK